MNQPRGGHKLENVYQTSGQFGPLKQETDPGSLAEEVTLTRAKVHLAEKPTAVTHGSTYAKPRLRIGRITLRSNRTACGSDWDNDHIVCGILWVTW